MTLKTQIASDVTDVFLNTDEFADTVTRNIGGDTASNESVTAVFLPKETPNRDESRGIEVVRIGTLHVDDDQTVLVTDSWIINGETWQTLKIGTVEGGLRTLHLQRNDVEDRGRAGNALK